MDSCGTTFVPVAVVNNCTGCIGIGVLLGVLMLWSGMLIGLLAHFKFLKLFHTPTLTRMCQSQVTYSMVAMIGQTLCE